ncbi:prepilin peptidase [Candidatus Woesearchaeota archaeon]|nr:prepilin peptidase [Candidatus Woesearchaeota archaeon]
MQEAYILGGLTFFSLGAASLFDLRTKEIPDWLSYGFLFSVLGIKFIAFLLDKPFSYFLWGLVGLATSVPLGLFLYYTKQWGGGDAKLLFGIGVVLFSSLAGFRMLGKFLLGVIFIGAAYGVLWVVIFCIRERPQVSLKVRQSFREKGLILLIPLLAGIVVSGLGFFIGDPTFLFAGIVLSLFTILFALLIFIKIVEQIGLVKKIPVSKLIPGDWIAEDVTVHGKILYRKRSPGVSPEQIAALRRAHVRAVLVKEGIPFVPVLFFSYLLLIFFGPALPF